MTWSEAITLVNGIASSCALPFVILAVLITFRKPILDGLTSIELGGFKANFSTKDVGIIAGIKEDAQSKVNWSRTGALFWFNSDVSDAFLNAFTGIDKFELYNLLNRSINHATQLNMDKAILASLRMLRDNALATKDDDWSPEKREQVAMELRRIFNSVAALSVAHENEVCSPPFKPDPD